MSTKVGVVWSNTTETGVIVSISCEVEAEGAAFSRLVYVSLILDYLPKFPSGCRRGFLLGERECLTARWVFPFPAR